MRLSTIPVFVFVALLLAACSITPAQRIQRDPASFAALSPEQQERVKTGSVGVGFDAATVRLALGEPDRVIERETAEGLTQVWVYYAIVAGYYSPYCHSAFPYYGRGYGYGYGNATDCRLSGPLQYEERERVNFKDGKVVSVERAK